MFRGNEQEGIARGGLTVAVILAGFESVGNGYQARRGDYEAIGLGFARMLSIHGGECFLFSADERCCKGKKGFFFFARPQPVHPPVGKKTFFSSGGLRSFAPLPPTNQKMGTRLSDN